MNEQQAKDYGGGYQRRWIPMDPRGAVITYVIIAINVIVFLVLNGMVRILGFDQSAMLSAFGAKENDLIATGQYWRLITPVFLHYDLLHLFFNCYAILIWGPMVEKLYGRFKYVVLYLISGMMGCLASYILSVSPSIGASGAVFGLLGGLLYFRQKWKEAFKRFFGPSLFIIIGFNLIYGFTGTGIDNWGHIGGLVGGFLVGNALGLYQENKARFDKVIFTVGIMAIFAGGIKLGYNLNLGDVYTALDAGEYDTALMEVADEVDARHDDLRVKIAVIEVYQQRIAYFQQIGDTESVKEDTARLLQWYPELGTTD